MDEPDGAGITVGTAATPTDMRAVEDRETTKGGLLGTSCSRIRGRASKGDGGGVSQDSVPRSHPT